MASDTWAARRAARRAAEDAAEAAEMAESGKPMPGKNPLAEKEEGKPGPEVAALPAVWHEIQPV